jgi:hypothetical protein
MALGRFFRRLFGGGKQSEPKSSSPPPGGGASGLRCPRCNTALDRVRDQYGQAAQDPVVAMFGILQTRLRCPKCRAVMVVTG